MANLERIAYMNHRIKTHGFVTRQEVAERFEVHIDTVLRDIGYMRDYLSAPIKYSRELGGYVYDSPFEMLFDSFDDAVFYYIFVSQLSNSMNLGGVPYVPVISKEILSKISSYIPAEFDELLDKISYDSSDFDTMDLTNFRNILESLLMKVRLEIKYLDSKGDVTSRAIEPIRLINYSGKWYLLAYCHKRRGLREFLVSRFTESRITEEPFSEIYTKSEIDRFVGNVFGIYPSERSETATIRIYEPASYFFLKQKWHKDQTMKETVVDGKKCLEITLPIGEYHYEIIARVMRYSPECEIVSPPALRREWLDHIKKIYEKFCK